LIVRGLRPEGGKLLRHYNPCSARRGIYASLKGTKEKKGRGGWCILPPRAGARSIISILWNDRKRKESKGGKKSNKDKHAYSLSKSKKKRGGKRKDIDGRARVVLRPEWAKKIVVGSTTRGLGPIIKRPLRGVSNTKKRGKVQLCG